MLPGLPLPVLLAGALMLLVQTAARPLAALLATYVGYTCEAPGSGWQLELTAILLLGGLVAGSCGVGFIVMRRRGMAAKSDGDAKEML